MKIRTNFTHRVDMWYECGGRTSSSGRKSRYYGDQMTERHNRIMIYGSKSDGTYVVEFKTAAGEALAISIPGGEAQVIRRIFRNGMPYGLVVPDAAARTMADSDSGVGSGGTDPHPQE